MGLLWRHLVWSLYWLQLGCFPDRDPHGRLYTAADGVDYTRRGRYLADGWSGQLWASQLDSDYETNTFHLTAATQGRHCGWCRASVASPLVWTDCSSAACPWTATVYTNESHAATVGDDQHRLFRVLPGFGCANSLPDPLHAKLLGSDQYCCGSAICLLTHHHMLGTPKENLDEVFDCIRHHYQEQNVPIRHRYPAMKVTQVKSGDVGHLPKLKGTGLQCHWLTMVLPDVFENFMDIDDERHRLVLLLLNCVRDSNKILSQNRRTYRFPAEASDRLIDVCFQAAHVTTALIQHYHPGTPVFHYTMKMHHTLHIALSSAYTNPMLWDCGSGEDLMKTVRQVMRGSKAGVPISKIGNTSLLKYVKAYHVISARDAPWWK